MKTIQELGEVVASRRRSAGLRQAAVAQQAGITAESLSRFERGRLPELGTRKLLAVLAVMGLELEVTVSGDDGNLDQLRIERNAARTGAARG